MKNLSVARLIVETKHKDATGQTIPSISEKEVLGCLSSVYQKEFYQAEQSGIRSEFVFETSAFDYNGEEKIKIGENVYSIYRTFKKGTDKIELYCGERVGNGK